MSELELRNIGDRGYLVPYVINHVKNNAYLRKLVCWNAHALFDARYELCAAFSARTLHTLDLNDCEFRWSGARAIAEFLRNESCMLAKLRMASNDVGDKGACELADALNGTRDLRYHSYLIV